VGGAVRGAGDGERESVSENTAFQTWCS
jgi:hypothetical protein